MTRREQIETLIVVIAAAGVMAMFTEPYWKPALIAWLQNHPLMFIDCGTPPK
jgi:hypothetical protein